ncbi:MAG: M42 family metallopeptidase [Eubacteriales bacterium]|nr:M42 family metallopeptidase [Eubacteriales bacterium]MDD4475606.1 M42 family metallopeptidase [Eubacteriales bacterium]
MENRDLDLEFLCNIIGPSGSEDAVREAIISDITPFADSVKLDAIGNLITFKKGRKSDKKIMFAAHMDEVGFMVKYITEDGRVLFDTLGGIDVRVMAGRRVVLGKNRKLGILSAKAIHMQTKEEREKTTPKNKMYIDIGCDSREEAEKFIGVGDTGSFVPNFEHFGDGFIKSKAIDDRFGCQTLCRLIREEPEYDTYFAFTTREEIGCRGAKAVTYQINPDLSVVIEATTAGDILGTPKHATACSLGKGAVLVFMDGGTIYDRELFRLTEKTAKDNNINYQVKNFIAGGTDSSAIQRSLTGVRVVGLAAPCRYIHSASCVVKESDLEDVYSLAKLLLTTDALIKGEN